MWLPKQSVVVPIDFSDDSIQALHTARELVQNAASLHVIHVLPVLEATEPGVMWETVSDESRRQHAEQALRERLDDPWYQDINVTIAVGNPGREIADFAQERQADLIVMPSHGRSGIARLLIGSVAERVLRLAHCPVLVLRK